MGWKHFIDNPQMASSSGFHLCVVTERPVPNSPVCSQVITYLASFANINIASGPFATNI